MNICVETSNIDNVSEIVSKVFSGLDNVDYNLIKVVLTKIIYVIQ